jgi:hypothetical protein
MQRDWARTAFLDGQGDLAFELRKRPIACEYDELSLVDEAERQLLNPLRERAAQRPFADVVQDVFSALAKLDPNGMVHAKTLYNGVNVIRRCPPGPLFAVLFAKPEYVTAGDGYWMFQARTHVL